MSKLSFKNVGIKKFSVEDTSLPVRLTKPIGIKTPLELDYDGQGLLVMHTNIADQIDDNFRNLILTNWGERIGKYNFGANLRPILCDFSHKENFDNEAMIRINTALTKWMPFISPDNYVSTILHSEKTTTARVNLQIEYSIPSLQITNRNIEVTLFTI